MAAAAEGPAEQQAGPKAPAVSPGGGSVLPACGRGEGGEGGGEEGERAEFSSYTEFLLTSLGYCVGLGNLIVYPGRVFAFGGGAFIIAYFVFLFVLGMPLYTHDLKVGQYYRRGAFWAFTSMHPALWGVGLGHVLIGFLMIVYFNTIIGWALIYFIHSFRSPLPWAGDTTSFFFDEVLGASTGLGDLNRIIWPVWGANLFAWLVTAAVNIKGVQSAGKVVYFTVTAPYICILALMIQGLTLPGAQDGVRAYLVPSVAFLKDYNTWVRAANQIFYSTGVAMGAIVTFGSYQSAKSRNYVRDGALIPFLNSITSFIGGFAVFPMLGHIAHNKGIEIGDLDLSAFSLTFVGYTEGLATFPNGLAQFFSVLFFLMIATLGIDTQIGVAEACITFVKELHFGRDRRNLSQPAAVVVVCTVGWLLSLITTTDAGYYYVTLLWDYGNYLSMFMVAGLSLVGSSWVAGRRWHNDASLALRGKAESPVLVALWWVIPALLACLLGIAVAGLVPYPATNGPHGDGTGTFPLWGQILSGVLNFGPGLIAVAALPTTAGWLWWTRRRTRRKSSFAHVELGVGGGQGAASP